MRRYVLPPGRNRTPTSNAVKIGPFANRPSVYSQRYSRDFWSRVRAGSVLTLSLLAPKIMVGFEDRTTATHISTWKIGPGIIGWQMSACGRYEGKSGGSSD